MNKQQLIQTLRALHGLSPKEACKIVDIFFDEIATALKKGDRVEIRGFCSFCLKKYKAYMGRNPKTGKKVRVKTKNLPFFKAGKELKTLVDSKN